MTHSSQAIGIFDSGIGGLTVMRELMRILPNERLIYLGDTARVPYGNKSAQTIIRYSIENAIALIEKDIKMLVIACNTASALALEKLRQLFKLPIIGVIEAGAEKAVSLTKNQRIAILGTKGTIQSGAYQAAIHQRVPHAKILPIACPLFVPLVEEQWIAHPVAELIVEEYLRPLQKEKIDTLLLGCTHYPLLSSLIQKKAGVGIALADSATTCASQVASLLQHHGLLSPLLQGSHQYFVSDDPAKFKSLAHCLFGDDLASVELLNHSY